MHPPIARFRPALIALLAACALALAPAAPARATGSDAASIPSRAAGDTVVAWGDNTHGQTSVPPGLTDVVQVAAGGRHTLALLSDGTVVAWGDNSHGQTSVPPGLTDVVQVAAGENFSAALDARGILRAWGQLNFTDSYRRPVQIAAGGYHIQTLSMFTNADEDWTILQGFGDNTYNQISQGAASGFQYIAAGQLHSLAIAAEGEIIVWGSNSAGQGEIPREKFRPLQVAGGRAHNLVLRENGTVAAWGGTLAQHPPSELKGVIQIAAGDVHNLALKADGTVVAWGEGGNQPPAGLSGVVQVDAGGKHSVAIVGGQRRAVAWGGGFQVPDTLGTVRQVAAGASHALALRSDGTVTAWGSNVFGQRNVPPIENPRMVAAGWNHSVALLANGTVLAWGDNNAGQASVPAGLGGVVQVAAGAFHTLALRYDGKVAAWGSAGATAMPALSQVRQVSAGAFHSAALTASGRVIVWGDNGRGQLNRPYLSSPVRQIAAGSYHTLALTLDGTVVAWGDNSSGQSSVPASLTNVVQVAAGGNLSMALKADGTVVAWGDTGSGVLSVPAGLGGVSQVAVGGDFALALTVDRQAPDTRITAGPAPLSDSAAATISFEGGDLGGGGLAGFACSLNGAPFAACDSPQRLSGLSEGSYSFRVRASDRFGNVEPSPAELSWTVDLTAPAAPTINSPANTAVLSSRRPTVSGSAEPLSTVTVTRQADGAALGVAMADASGSWSLTPASNLADGTLTLIARAADRAGNLGPASAGVTVRIDTVRPGATVAPAPGQASPANLAPVRFVVSFSEPVSGLAQSDLQLGGDAGPSDVTLSELAPFNGTAYAVEVSGMSGPGAVTLILADGAAADAAGNPSAAASGSISFSPIVPVVTGIVALDPSPTNAAGVRYRVTFSEPVSGVDAADFALFTDVSGAAVGAVSGAGAEWTVAVTTGSGDGSLRLDLVDDGSISNALGALLGGVGAGDGDFAAGATYTLDRTAPTATLVVPPQVQRGAASATFAVRYADNLALLADSLGTGAVRVSGPGGFSRLVVLVSLAPGGEGGPHHATYRIDAPAGGWAPGSYTIALVAGQASDTAGNKAAAAQLGGFAVTEEAAPRFTIYLPVLMRAHALSGLTSP